MKLTGDEIINVVDNLIGKVEPIGSTTVDVDRLHNLKTLIWLTNWCVDSVKSVAEMDRYREFSIAQACCTARDALYEWEEWVQCLKENTK